MESALDAGVKSVVLSSTAAVYGVPQYDPLDEIHPTVPVNPYGETKLAIERMLASYASAYGLRVVALRYFNAAGADVESGLDERHHPETHLIPIVLQAALGLRPDVTISGRTTIRRTGPAFAITCTSSTFATPTSQRSTT